MTLLPRDPALEAVIRDAGELARRRRHGPVTAEHLLCALLASPRGAEIIVGAGGDIAELRTAADRALGPALGPDIGLARALARASVHAEAAGRAAITIDGVLAAIYREDIGALLVDHRVPRLAVLDFICHGITTLPRTAAALPRAWVRAGAGAAPPAPAVGRAHVIFHNDDYTTREMVVWLLASEFGKTDAEAEAIMTAVHDTGAAVVGSYPLGAALHKLESAVRQARDRGYPLRVTTEPAE